jgi:hypothetical protein
MCLFVSHLYWYALYVAIYLVITIRYVTAIYLVITIRYVTAIYLVITIRYVTSHYVCNRLAC